MVTTEPSLGPLPEFKNPPVNEVACSVVFSPLTEYTTAHSGLFWHNVRGKYTRAEQREPLVIPPELEAPPTLESALTPPELARLVYPRIWLLTSDGTELIQLQRDVFVRNWRQQRGDETYPRFPTLFQRFEEDFRAFRHFVREQRLGTIEPSHCELTYVNNIFTPGGRGSSELGRVLITSTMPAKGFLPEPDDCGYRSRYSIRTPAGFLGRLTVTASPAVRRSDQRELIALNLTVRGRPTGRDDSGIAGFFRIAHEWIVRGFDELTRPEMHAQWGRL
jgi:uncharacterized protein (TIGR04255 family)